AWLSFRDLKDNSAMSHSMIRIVDSQTRIAGLCRKEQLNIGSASFTNAHGHTRRGQQRGRRQNSELHPGRRLPADVEAGTGNRLVSVPAAFARSHTDSAR